MDVDTEADIVADRGEPVSSMEPLIVSDKHRAELTDLALDLTHKSARFRASLPPSTVSSLADLVRAMNCYYSNLIEGHNTHPVDIERALRGDYSHNPHSRDLQLDAKAHIVVQKWIDDGGLKGRAVVSPDGISEIHRRFCELLAQELLWVEDPETKVRAGVVPGQLRARDVRVGNHMAISPGALPSFLARFAEVYGRVGRTEAILRMLPLTSGSSGCTLSSMATDASPASCRMRFCSMHLIRARYGRSPAAWRAVCRNIRAICPNATCLAATTSTAVTR